MTDRDDAEAANDPAVTARILADRYDGEFITANYPADTLRACADEIDRLRDLARWVTDQLSPGAVTAAVREGRTHVTDAVPYHLGDTARRVWPDAPLSVAPPPEVRAELIRLIRYLYDDLDHPAGGPLHVALDDYNVEDEMWHGGGSDNLRTYWTELLPGRFDDTPDEVWDVCGRIATLMLTVPEMAREAIIVDAHAREPSRPRRPRRRLHPGPRQLCAGAAVNRFLVRVDLPGLDLSDWAGADLHNSLAAVGGNPFVGVNDGGVLVIEIEVSASGQMAAEHLALLIVGGAYQRATGALFPHRRALVRSAVA